MKLGRRYVSWNTPVSSEEFLLLNMRYDNWRLELFLDPSTEDIKKKKTKITFNKVAAFRSISERYMNYLWGDLSGSGVSGRTFIVEDSEWIQTISRDDATFVAFEKSIAHYAILTDVEVLEILSSNEPEIS